MPAVENVEVPASTPTAGTPTIASSAGSTSGGLQGIPPSAPLTGLAPNDVLKKIVGIKKAMTKSMTESIHIPGFTFSDEYDVTELSGLREQMKKAHPKLTLLPFFLKAASLALRDFPEVNSHVNPATDAQGYVQE